MVVKTTTSAALAAAHSIEPDRWWDSFGALMDRIRPRFGRYEPARHAGALMLGLLSGLDRKNCWTIAERRGDESPNKLQHLLSRAVWDADGVRDDLRSYVKDAFDDRQGILVVDETGDLKKGTQTVAVQRQYTGTAGRIENAQVAVYLTYTAPRGHALIDRALYVPKSWIEDPGRRERAGIPAETRFATKPALALHMIISAVDGGLSASFVAGDEVYGNDPKLAAALEERGVGYVLAVSRDHRVPTELGPVRADSLVAGFGRESWQVHSAGVGSKGPRLYSWALLPIPDDRSGHRWMLWRRNDSTGEMAFFRCYSPTPAPLRELIRVAGLRWTIEESFQCAKGQAGLDEHQVRCWKSWHRWVTPVDVGDGVPGGDHGRANEQAPALPGLIPLTLNEFRRLFDALVLGATATNENTLKWSIWRRKHQFVARACHYRRRSEAP